MVSMFKSYLLLLCSLAVAQEDKKIFDLRPKTMLMRNNREAAKPATSAEETPAEPEHKIFDLRKKHSDNPPPSSDADVTANLAAEQKPPAEPERKKVFDLSKKHSQDQQELKQHGPENSPDTEPEHKKVFDLTKKHSGQKESETKKQPSVIHVENVHRSQPVYKAASNFVVVEPKKPKEEAQGSTKTNSEVSQQKAPMLMRNANLYHQHGEEAEATAASKGTGWFSFLLAMVLVISFLLAVANFIQRGARLHAGKPGRKGDFFQQVADLFSEASFKDFSSLLNAVPAMQPAKDPMKEV